MEQYKNFLIYFLLGVLGALVHWWKKRYVDKTTSANLTEYILDDFNNTAYFLLSMAIAEAGLSESHTGGIFTLQEVIGAITLGYTFDSGINKASSFTLAPQSK